VEENSALIMYSWGTVGISHHEQTWPSWCIV